MIEGDRADDVVEFGHDQRPRIESRWVRERAGIDPEERRRSLNHWVKGLLAKSLPMPADAAMREKFLGQCAAASNWPDLYQTIAGLPIFARIFIKLAFGADSSASA